MMSDEVYLEPIEKLAAPAQDMHRALRSLIGEVEGLDAYIQRYEACTDPELRLVIAHHRDKAKAHIAMLLEWMRRRDAKLDKQLREALFKAGPITAQFHGE
jgi:hypothetical protein